MSWSLYIGSVHLQRVKTVRVFYVILSFLVWLAVQPNSEAVGQQGTVVVVNENGDLWPKCRRVKIRSGVAATAVLNVVLELRAYRSGESGKTATIGRGEMPLGRYHQRRNVIASPRPLDPINLPSVILFL